MNVENDLVSTDPYCLYPSASGVNIRWFSDLPYCGKVVFSETGADKEQCANEQEESVSHSICLSGLKPFTRYEYYICSKEKKYYFHTGADAGDSFRFVVFGDPQGHEHLRQTMAVAGGFKPHFALGLGDFADRASHELYAQFIDKSQALLANTALFPTPGNHDYRRCSRPFSYDNDTLVYDLFFGNGTGNNYIFDYGKLRFIMLNYPDADTVKIADESGKWLRRQLVAARHLNKKVVVSHHCPCFTSTAVDWAVEDTLIPPLAEEFGDTLLIDFGAHIHTYERSMYPNDNGACFITTGGAGELYLQYPINQRENVFQKIAEERCHVCLVEVDQQQITLKAVDIENQEIDSFEIVY